jgi:hypothetical protein
VTLLNTPTHIARDFQAIFISLIVRNSPNFTGFGFLASDFSSISLLSLDLEAPGFVGYSQTAGLGTLQHLIVALYTSTEDSAKDGCAPRSSRLLTPINSLYSYQQLPSPKQGSITDPLQNNLQTFEVFFARHLILQMVGLITRCSLGRRYARYAT